MNFSKREHYLWAKGTNNNLSFYPLIYLFKPVERYIFNQKSLSFLCKSLICSYIYYEKGVTFHRLNNTSKPLLYSEHSLYLRHQTYKGD